MSRDLTIVGSGRAGSSFASALAAAGWQVELLGHDDARLAGTTRSVLLCVPDSAVEAVARSITPSGSRAVLHCSGSLGLDVLDPAPRRGSVHPLASLPDTATGAERLAGAWYAVCGDGLAADVVDALGGTAVEVPDGNRAAYHAAAAVASNHLVALLGQAERIARSAGVPLEAYRRLASESLEGAFERDPATVLTGPVARGDWETVRRHLDALDPSEREGYLAMARMAARLVGRELPDSWG